MAHCVLIIEDEPDIRKTIDYNLSKESFKVVQAESITEGEKALAANKVDVIILDLMLPDGSGLTLCRDIKSDAKTKHIPVIILTAKTEEVDRVVGFELGADDYVTKPFSPRELTLRVKNILRRGKTNADGKQPVIEIQNISIDPEKHEVLLDDEKVTLTATEFKLLYLLASRQGRIQSRERLLEDVWEYEADVYTRTVDTHMRRLRKKLGESADLIETVRGVGYRFIDN